MPPKPLPKFEIRDFSLPSDCDASAKKSPSDMVTAAFVALDSWFGAIVPRIEKEWQKGVTANDGKVETQTRLGKLIGEVKQVKRLLIAYVNAQLKTNPAIAVDDFMLPRDATIEGTKKAPEVIGAAFKPSKIGGNCLIAVIKPAYTKFATAGASAMVTQVRLGGLEGTVNMMKTFLASFINAEIARKANGQCYAALASGEEEVAIPDNVGLTVLEEILDVEIGNTPAPEVDENVSVDIGAKF